MGRAETCAPSYLVLVGQKAYQLKPDSSVTILVTKT